MTTDARITAWSYSRWKDYAQCPRKAQYKHVLKLKEPSNKAMERGSSIHKEAELYLQGVEGSRNVFELPLFGPKGDEDRPIYAKKLDALKKQGAVAEEKWTFTETWGTTGWFDRDAWCRMGIDAYALKNRNREMLIVDYKTGKVRDENRKQLGIYALGAFTQRPELKRVVTEFWYVDANEQVRETFDVTEKEDILDAWMRRITPMLNDTIFAARPGPLCKWCHFRKANGGPCEF